MTPAATADAGNPRILSSLPTPAAGSSKGPDISLEGERNITENSADNQKEAPSRRQRALEGAILGLKVAKEAFDASEILKPLKAVSSVILVTLEATQVWIVASIFAIGY